MKRSPDFSEIEGMFGGTGLVRPDDEVGDYLENRRVLRALQKKFHFEELEDIIDDDEALDAFYVFDGTRFMKDKVVNLFDNSEYSFYSMFMFLVDKSFGGLYEPGASNAVYGAGVYNFLSKEDVDFEHFVSLSQHIKKWSTRLDYSWLDKYGSDFHYVNEQWDKSFSSFVNRVSIGSRNLLSPAVLTIPQMTRKMFWRFVFDWRFAARVRTFKFTLSNVSRAIMVNYFRSLSACMNLPDDKHAKAKELELIDKWLELFEAFYPEYEKLKTWYIKEKEGIDSVEVRV